eukprot:COSAG04_NODE_664_length_11441_cov_5.400458_10_plen_151_part_01
MAELCEDMGFETHKLLNATRAEINDLVRTKLGGIEPGSEVLFYFAGHGAQHGGENFLLPRGMSSHAPAELQNEAIPVNRVLKQLSGDAHRRAGTVGLFFFDCCRERLFLGGRRSFIEGSVPSFRVRWSRFDSTERQLSRHCRLPAATATLS